MSWEMVSAEVGMCAALLVSLAGYEWSYSCLSFNRLVSTVASMSQARLSII
jgi:hypothetical protein